MKHLTLTIVITLLIASCTEKSNLELFDQGITERIEAKENELRNELESAENGWILTYFTDNTSLGGFTFLFDFLDDKNVKMLSDLTDDASTNPTTSEYTINIGKTVQLSFVTKGRIHELSDSGNAPNSNFAGKGYKGSFEFSYYGKVGDNLTFRDIREDNLLIFKKASAEDWKSRLTKNRTIASKIDPNNDKPAFGGLSVEKGDDTKTYSFSLDLSTRYANVSRTLESGEKDDLSFGIAYTPTGIVINPPIKSDDVLIDKFEYDEKTKKFIANQGGAKVTIEYSNVLIGELPFYDIKGKRMFEFNGKSVRYNYLELEKTSTKFKDLLTQVNKDTKAIGYDIKRIYLRRRITAKDDPYVELYETGDSSKRWRLYFKYELKDDGKIYFELTGNTNAPTDLQKAYKPILDIILGSTKGYYIKNTEGLQIYTNQTFTLISADDSQYQINFFDF